MEFGVILVRKKDASDSILIFIVSAASFFGVFGYHLFPLCSAGFSDLPRSFSEEVILVSLQIY